MQWKRDFNDAGLDGLRLVLWVVTVVFVGMSMQASRADTHDLTIVIGPLPDGSTQTHVYSIQSLTELSKTEYTTSTVWTESLDRFSGVLLWDMLAHLGVDPEGWNGQITLEAIDGYSATLGPAHVDQTAPLLAILRNGRPMPLRERGPFWLIFPYDAEPAFRNETIYALSVWQIAQMSITP